MTDTAIPTPDDLETAVAPLTQPAREASEQIARALGTTARDAEKGIQALGRILREHKEA